MANEEYKVEGYGERRDYDAPYHPTADLDPAVKFAHAGDPETAAAAAAAEYADKHAHKFVHDSVEEAKAAKAKSETSSKDIK